MEGGRYFRTGAYEKEKYLEERLIVFLNIIISNKCEKNVNIM